MERAASLTVAWSVHNVVDLVIVLIAVGIVASLAIYLQIIEAAAIVNSLGGPAQIGETKMSLKYKFPRFEPVPEGADVARQFLLVRAGGFKVNPVIELPLDATSAEFSVPRDMEIEVTRCWEDSNGNMSEGEPVKFFSLDTVAPPQPLPLGDFELICEDDTAN